MKRAEAIKIALKYPEGLGNAKNFAAVNAPFSPDAYRFENGTNTAGPDCTFNPTCKDIHHPVACGVRAPRPPGDPRRRRR